MSGYRRYDPMRVNKKHMRWLVPLIVASACGLLYLVCTSGPGGGESEGIQDITTVGKVTGPLALKVRVEKQRVKAGLEEAVAYAELHNLGGGYLCVNVSGFQADIDFTESESVMERLRETFSWTRVWTLRTGRHYPSTGHIPARKARENFLTLAPGSYYGVTFRWLFRTGGKLRWRISYSNSATGAEHGLSAWVGSVEPVISAQILVTD
jgi:hypothetical protein